MVYKVYIFSQLTKVNSCPCLSEEAQGTIKTSIARHLLELLRRIYCYTSHWLILIDLSDFCKPCHNVTEVLLELCFHVWTHICHVEPRGVNLIAISNHLHIHIRHEREHKLAELAVLSAMRTVNLVTISVSMLTSQ